MKFLLKHNAYVNIPTHLVNDPPDVVRLVPNLIRAEPSAPVELELPDDIDPNSISRSWEPLDAAARAAQDKLARPRMPAAPSITPDDITKALLAMPADQRSALLAAAAAQERQAKAEAEQAGTMSGALKNQAKAQKV